MPSTSYLQTLVLNKVLRGINFAAGPYYAALFVANPTASGEIGYEVSAGDYNRIQVTFDSLWANENELFWYAESNWGSVTYFGLCTASVGRYVIAYTQVPTMTILANVGVRVPAGGLTVSMT